MHDRTRVSLKPKAWSDSGLTLTLELIPHPIWLMNEAGDLLFCNAALRDLADGPLPNLAALIASEDQAEIMNRWDTARTASRRWTFRALIAGSPFERRAELRPIEENRPGSPRLWVGSLLDTGSTAPSPDADLTDLRLTLEAAQMGTWDWDVQSGWVRWGGLTDVMLGFASGTDRIRFEEYVSRIHPDDRDGVEAAIRRALETGEPYESEMRVVKPDGSSTWVMGRGRSLTTPDGNLRMLGTTVDINEFKLLQERLQRVTEVQRRFVSEVSHELRAPLTAIVGNLELTRRYPDMLPEQRQQALSEAHTEARRLGRLVGDLLALARGGTEAAVEYDRLRLDDVLQAAFDEARHLSSGQELTSSGFQPTLVQGNRDHLKQLVLVLLDNALKYTPSDGRVQLELTETPGWVEVRVTDTGIGIAPEQLERVFDRFFRASESRALDPNGTGLGLSIAKAIVEAHGGQIRIESRLGLGSTVIVRLPFSSET